MIPLLVLVVTFAAALLAGRLGLRPLRSWRTCLRVALAAMFLLTASAHWGAKRADLVAMVPPGFGDPETLVTWTGIAEVAGAVGLLVPRVAPWAAAGLALLLIAVFPANVRAAELGLTIGGRAVPDLWPRAAIQLVFLVAVLAAGFGPRRRGSRSAAAR